MPASVVFGPVPSRRLGLSLGVDLVPYKTCSFDCVYCECGKTTCLTHSRKMFIDTDVVINELKTFLDKNHELEIITFSGSGEPTLASNIGQIISFLKSHYPQYPIALLTNASLFDRPEVRQELLDLDIVIPSLDSATESVFQQINRPAKGLHINKIINGIKAFRKEFKNQLIIEVFIIPSINDNISELTHFKKELTEIRPDKIQLNTLDRPGTEPWVRGATLEELTSIMSFLQPLNVEIISKVTSSTLQKSESNSQFDSQSKSKSLASLKAGKSLYGRILDTVARRPCTKEDLSEMLGIDTREISKYLAVLLSKNQIEAVREKRGVFYKQTL
ncbi:radical SAM protein [Thermoproteota archaeon]